MNKQVAVIIPLYKDSLNNYEKIALAQCKKILGTQQIVIVKPFALKLPTDIFDNITYTVEEFDDVYFNNIQGYNQLMLSALFYERFLAYEYMLIYQLDCFVFKDDLAYWCNQNWDYIGAPWIRKTYHKNKLELVLAKIKNYIVNKFSKIDSTKPNQLQLINKVGNGGFSLRRVSAFHKICLSMGHKINLYLNQNSSLYNEDVFWSIEVNRDKNLLNIPNVSTAINFAFEVPPFKSAQFTEKNTPFGCHDWDHYLDFWKPIFKQHGYEI
jgi:hypothetical protein